MKAADVQIGATYEVLVSDKPSPVLVESRNYVPWGVVSGGYWACTNLRTMRTILIKTPERFRRLLTRAERVAINTPLLWTERLYYASLAADDPSDPAWAVIAEEIEGDV